MGSRYLTDLADVCRKTGYPVTEVGSAKSTPGDAWKQRSRSSGGYDSGKPNHIICHHTAGSSDHWKLSNTLVFDHSDKPCANIALSRDGAIFVQAGGASNHAGTGQDPCSPNVTADDCMNSQSIGIEAANLGNGETWPSAQLDSYVRLCGELCRAYDIPVERIHSHFEWAPDRKVDPKGPPKYASGNAMWDMDQFRRDVTAYLGGDAPPPPDTEDDPPTVSVTLELPNLVRGDRGPAVKRMQHLLAAAGFMDESNTSNYDGDWGGGTDDAKQRFDVAHGLLPSPPTDCGPASWRALLGDD
jgi:hypothetical protein